MNTTTHSQKGFATLNKCLMTGTFMLVFLAFNTLWAQPKSGKPGQPGKKEKIEALRIQYFNEKLSLSETEQKNFWPLYNEFKQKEKALRDSFKRQYKPNDIVFMNDKQAEEFLNAGIKLQDDQNTLFKMYIDKFKKVLPIKKVAMLPMLEKSFRKDMIKKAGMHKKGGAGRPGKPGSPDGPGDDE